MAVQRLTAEEKAAIKGLNKTALKDYEKRESFAKEITIEEGEGDYRRPIKSRKSHSVIIAEEFVQKVREAVSQIMTDELYDARQKAVMIERTVAEKREEYLGKIDELIEEHNEPLDEIGGYIDAELAAHERITPAEQREIEFQTAETMGRVKTELLMSPSPERIVDTFDKLLKQAEHNQYTARFLSHHGYLFLERLSQFPESVGRDRAVSSIRQGINKAQGDMLDDKARALVKMRSNLKEMRRSGIEGKRLINHHVEPLIRKARELVREHELAEQKRIEAEAQRMYLSNRR